MQLVGEYSDIPVPSVIAEELSGDVLGQTFYIMEKTEGLIPPDVPPYHMDGWLTQETPESRATVWNEGIRAMAGVHNIDCESGGIQEALARLDVPKNLEQQLDYWENYYQWGYQSDSGLLTHDVAEQVLPWLRSNKPQEQAIRLCWGDSRMANVIFNSEKNAVAALLDWEMVNLGDPLQDLAWWIYMDELFSHGLGFPPLDGFPSREQSIAVWTEATGLSADNMDYYLVYAGLRFALILGRMSISKGNQESIDSHFNNGFEVQYLLNIFNLVGNVEG
jgi:aminoglycoside phosphotransferase (APT) family kinase protein